MRHQPSEGAHIPSDGCSTSSFAKRILPPRAAAQRTLFDDRESDTHLPSVSDVHGDEHAHTLPNECFLPPNSHFDGTNVPHTPPHARLAPVVTAKACARKRLSTEPIVLDEDEHALPKDQPLALTSPERSPAAALLQEQPLAAPTPPTPTPTGAAPSSAVQAFDLAPETPSVSPSPPSAVVRNASFVSSNSNALATGKF